MALHDHDPLADDERIESIAPRLLNATPECQPRLINRDEVIDDYAERMMAGDVFPPVQARFDGTDYYLSNGFHRRAAAIKAALATIPVRIRPGDVLDAIEDSCAANTDHGLRRTNEDKKRAIERLLRVDVARGRRRSDEAIAHYCSVDRNTVAKYRREILGNKQDTVVEVTTKHGTTYLMETANLGGRRGPSKPFGEMTVADFEQARQASAVALERLAEMHAHLAELDAPQPSTTEVVQAMSPAFKEAFGEFSQKVAASASVGLALANAKQQILRQRNEVARLLADYGNPAVHEALSNDRSLIASWRELIWLCRDFADYLEGSGA